MRLYLAWWDNGFGWDDHRTELLGAFSSEEKAKEIASQYNEGMREHNNPYSYWYIEEWELDTPFIINKILKSK